MTIIRTRGADHVALLRDAIRVFHAFPLRVAGTSMVPAIRPGDTLTITHAEIDDLAISDIVLFARGDRLFVHRVVRRATHSGQRCIVTRGDSHHVDDPPVAESELLGRVTAVSPGSRTMRFALVASGASGLLRLARVVRERCWS